MICKLCETDTKLCNSHIISEFLYKVLYDKKHRMYIVPSDSTKQVDVSQKGFREKLLCDKCEKRFSKYETYTASLLFDGKLPIQKDSNSNEYFKVSNVNYTYFKLFLLSILWRASIATDEFFKFVSIGGKHQEAIRTMLLAEQPGTYYQYGCLMASVELGGELFDMIRMPDKIKMENHNSYRFLMGGFMWVFVVSNHSNLFPQKRLFLQEDGSQTVLKFNVKDLPFISKDFKSFKSQETNMRFWAKRHGIDLSK